MAPPRKTRIERQCVGCPNTFPTIPSTRKVWCSKACRAANDPTAIIALAAGRASTHVAQRGEQRWNWKGDEVGYNALHTFVARNFACPGACEHCDTSERRLQWAQRVKGSVSRERADWLRLCASCHKFYDTTPAQRRAGSRRAGEARRAVMTTEDYTRMARLGAARRWGHPDPG